MGEKVKDTFFFEQTRDKFESGFPVLNAVLALGISCGERVLEIGEAKVCENLLDDLGCGLALEDLAIRIHGEQPEPGIEIRVVGGEAFVAPGLDKTADNPVDVPCVPTGERD